MVRAIPRQNPKNRFFAREVELEVPAPPADLVLIDDHSRSIVAENDSPDVGFRFSVNPYRGCLHGCAYCYARPSHEYLGLGTGSDFERKILVKREAPTLLRAALEKRSWQGELVVLSGNTDPYQPLGNGQRVFSRAGQFPLRGRWGWIWRQWFFRRQSRSGRKRQFVAGTPGGT